MGSQKLENNHVSNKATPKPYGKIVLSLTNCLLPDEKLNPTPSKVDGLDSDTETDLRILGCELIQTAGILLKLPQVAMATGQVLFQRFYYSKSFVRHPMETTAMGCVCLASKIEEAPRRIRDVINVFHHIRQVKNQKTIQPVILDQHYIAQKTQVIKAERRVLKELGFCVHVKHPHKIIVMYLQVLGYEKHQSLMQLSWNYMNDALRSDVFVRYDPETVACACIYLSARRLKISLPKTPAWYTLFHVTQAQIEDVCRRIMRLYIRSKPNSEDLEKKVEELRKEYQEARQRARGILSGNNTPNSGASPVNNISPKNNHADKRRSDSRSRSRSHSRSRSPSKHKRSKKHSRGRSRSLERRSKKSHKSRRGSYTPSPSPPPHKRRDKTRYRSRSRTPVRSSSYDKYYPSYKPSTVAPVECVLDGGDYIIGGDIMKAGGDVIDYLSGLRGSCGPPARVQGSLIFKNGEPLTESERSFPDGTEVTFNCIASIMGEKISWRIVCEDGSWLGRSLSCDVEDPQDSSAVKDNSTCIFRNTEPNVVTFYRDQPIKEDVVEFTSGTALLFRCADIGKYAMIGSKRRRCSQGEWEGQRPVCFGLNQENDYALEKPPTILFRHQLGPIAQSNEGTLIVYPGSILHMECLWIRRFGTPKWVVSHNYRKYPEGWSSDPGRDSQLEYRLSIFHASRDDSGTFTCITPTRHTHSVEIEVKAVHCSELPPRRGLKLSTQNTKMNTRVLLSCANGNSLIGAPEIVCLPSGNWSAPVPVCESMECPDLGNLSDPNLRATILSREVGGQVMFSCTQGFGLIGPAHSTCLPSGEWAAPLPHCKEVQCDKPGVPENGYIQGQGVYKAGDLVQFNCNPDHMMEGQPIIACQENGRWSGVVPRCVQACAYPGTAISGRMSSVKFYYQINETVTFTCDDGLVMQGAAMLRCQHNGKWSNAVPTCVPPGAAPAS